MASYKKKSGIDKQKVILVCLIAALVVLAVIIIIVLCSTKPMEPTPLSSSNSFSSEFFSSNDSDESSSDDKPSDSSSSSSSLISSSSSVRSSSSANSSEEDDGPEGSNIVLPENTPYSVDTDGKQVRNAFDENGDIDLLFPISIKYYVTKNFSVRKSENVGNDKKMDYRAAPHCREMIAAMKKELGSAITPFSTIRTYSYQQGNFNRKKQKYLDMGYSEIDAYKKASTIVAIPGTSEHQLGLAVDLYLYSLYNRDGELNESFENTPEYTWLCNHAHEYGFILSFPKDKVANTGIIYEPWHFRYVGIENAKTIKESGMTLAEWLDSQNIVFVYNGK